MRKSHAASQFTRKMAGQGQTGGLTKLELMDTQDICEWLKRKSGKPFDEQILTAIKGLIMCGEAVIYDFCVCR